jgi:hypothetical protein
MKKQRAWEETMRHLSKIFVFTVAVVILTLSLALAGGKFKNEDTAKNRQTNSFGTDQDDETSSIEYGTNSLGDSTIKSKARPKKEAVDWYDKIIITVNPDTQWPKGDGTAKKTTTQTKYDNATDTQTTTTTTTEDKKW